MANILFHSSQFYSPFFTHSQKNLKEIPKEGTGHFICSLKTHLVCHLTKHSDYTQSIEGHTDLCETLHSVYSESSELCQAVYLPLLNPVLDHSIHNFASIQIHLVIYLFITLNVKEIYM